MDDYISEHEDGLGNGVHGFGLSHNHANPGRRE